MGWHGRQPFDGRWRAQSFVAPAVAFLDNLTQRQLEKLGSEQAQKRKYNGGDCGPIAHYNPAPQISSNTTPSNSSAARQARKNVAANVPRFNFALIDRGTRSAGRAFEPFPARRAVRAPEPLLRGLRS